MSAPDPPPDDSTTALLRAMDERSAARKAAAAKPGPAPAPAAHNGAGPDPYVLAAAVLHVFDPVELHPYGRDAGPGRPARAAVLAASSPAVGYRHAGLRILRPDARKAALSWLDTRETMRAALDVNPERTRTGVQAAFEIWVGGGGFVLDRMSSAELEDLRQLFDWGLPAHPGLPPFDSVEQAKVRRSAVAGVEHLVDRHFVGRRRELALLRDHVFGDPDRARGPLTIWAPGGSGKSALVGRFLIGHIEESDQGGFPFAYLPFDSETLDVREPFTILLAVVAQLSAQAGPSPAGSPLYSAAEEFRAAVEQYRDRRGSLQRRASAFAARRGRIRSLSETERQLYEAFAGFVRAALDLAAHEHGAAPVLLVFDTFGEVEYRSAEDLIGFWRMVRYLMQELPRLRIVIVGRTQPAVPAELGFPQVELPIGDLDEAHATALLVGLGVSDPAIALAIARQVGGNPLSIHLAARVAAMEDVDAAGIRGLGSDRLVLYKIGAALVRGRLYRRVLDHIDDPDVRVLAHPGMVLRRVTTEVIEGVLAPACGLVGVDTDRSRELFDALRREPTLVSLDADGSLRFREEVRGPVLELLARDRPAHVLRVHELAVAHYGALADPADRAEELYHRMMLGQPAAELDGRWLPEIERFLASAVDELPRAQRRWLAGRMSIELPAEVYVLADIDEWERLIGHKAMEVVRYAGPDRVLALLGERTERTPESPLYALEARALLDLGRPSDAAMLLDRALAGFPAVGNPGRLAEILWLRALAAAAAGRADERLAFLDRLTEVAAGLTARVTLVQALAETLDAAAADAARTGRARHALSEALRGLSEAEVSGERSLVRLALVRLGPNHPAVLAALAPHVLFDLAYLAVRGLVDLGPAIDPFQDCVTRYLPQLLPTLPDLRHPVDEAAVSAVLIAVVEELRIRTAPALGDGDHGSIQPLTEAVLAVLATEGASLASSSLAGIDDYREAWELQATAEVAS